MKDKIVLITGASSGIGKATAIALAKLGATILFVSRNEQRGKEALQEIKNESQNQNIHFYNYDVSLMANVRQLVEAIKKEYPRIDVLINNAGILPGKHTLTAEGLELCWATNHLAGFLLTLLLSDLLLKADTARIINVSSEAHRMGQLNFDQPVSQNQYASFTAYCDSKLANILFTYELSRRLELTSITVNCLHPGVIASNFGNTGYGVLKWVFKLARPFMKNTEQGAATVVYLATSSEVSSVSCKYFKNLKPVNSSKQSYNTHVARRLWNHSEVQTGLATEL